MPPMENTVIHRLDLLDYTEGTAEQKKNFSDAIGRAFNETGFVTIRNHGLNNALIQELYQEVKALFDLPEATKKNYEIAGLGGQRGYTSKGREKAKDANTPDLKEFWQVGQFLDGSNLPMDTYPENILVNENQKFNDITKEVYKRLEKAGAEILKAIAVYLNLPEDFFEADITDGNSILRAIHYFPIENPAAVPAEAVRAGAHEDINLITLLIGASADGLQILTKQNNWFPVTAIEDDIVVNVGDMLQRLTNNKLKSTTHRVVNPPIELMKTSRYSVPFFLHPKSEMDLSCLANCIDAGQEKKYEDITAGDYLEERLREIGLK